MATWRHAHAAAEPAAHQLRTCAASPCLHTQTRGCLMLEMCIPSTVCMLCVHFAAAGGGRAGAAARQPAEARAAGEGGRLAVVHRSFPTDLHMHRCLAALPAAHHPALPRIRRSNKRDMLHIRCCRRKPLPMRPVNLTANMFWLLFRCCRRFPRMHPSGARRTTSRSGRWCWTLAAATAASCWPSREHAVWCWGRGGAWCFFAASWLYLRRCL